MKQIIAPASGVSEAGAVKSQWAALALCQCRFSPTPPALEESIWIEPVLNRLDPVTGLAQESNNGLIRTAKKLL
jgi:hypothetical protein